MCSLRTDGAPIMINDSCVLKAASALAFDCSSPNCRFFRRNQTSVGLSAAAVARFQDWLRLLMTLMLQFCSIFFGFVLHKKVASFQTLHRKCSLRYHAGP